jgi:hypothetical protein
MAAVHFSWVTTPSCGYTNREESMPTIAKTGMMRGKGESIGVVPHVRPGPT